VNVFKVFNDESEAKKFLKPYIKSILKMDGRNAIEGRNREWLQKNNALSNRYNDGEVVLALINYIY
jgi:hypothetical protein